MGKRRLEEGRKERGCASGWEQWRRAGFPGSLVNLKVCLVKITCFVRVVHFVSYVCAVWYRLLWCEENVSRYLGTYLDLGVCWLVG